MSQGLHRAQRLVTRRRLAIAVLAVLWLVPYQIPDYVAGNLILTVAGGATFGWWLWWVAGRSRAEAPKATRLTFVEWTLEVVFLGVFGFMFLEWLGRSAAVIGGGLVAVLVGAVHLWPFVSRPAPSEGAAKE